MMHSVIGNDTSRACGAVMVKAVGQTLAGKTFHRQCKDFLETHAMKEFMLSVYDFLTWPYVLPTI
jgi:hypothetical protein